MPHDALTADFFWQDGAWRTGDGALGVSGGRFAATAHGERAGRFVLPGMPNLHSHAFQRAMAGLAERRGPGEDSFWTWRETMYAFAEAIDPDDLKAIATQLYVEMVKAGYTQVCEFHYLHHGPRGVPYADPATMSLALMEAARKAGIGLTLLPVLYMTGGFDEQAADREAAALPARRGRVRTPARAPGADAGRHVHAGYRAAFAARGAGGRDAFAACHRHRT